MEEKAKKKVHIPSLCWGLVLIAMGVVYALFNRSMPTGTVVMFSLMWAAMGVSRIIQGLRGGPVEPEPDPRPLEVRLREQMQDYDEGQLHSILDDKLRSDLIRGIARDLLEQKGLPVNPS
jgi:hypothetical protein